VTGNDALKMTAEQIDQVIRGAFPAAKGEWLKVEEVRPGYARIRIPFRPSWLRPGNVVSGPALFAAADTAMYACVMAHIGPAVMAVTANLNITFLNPAPAGDIVAEALMLKLGQRLAFMEVSLFTGDAKDRVAHVTGSYALPRPR